jgi:hypothetical protein
MPLTKNLKEIKAGIDGLRCVFIVYCTQKPIPVAALSKAWVCVGPLACWHCGLQNYSGHNGLSVVSCQVERSLRRADRLSRGVLPTVVCLSVTMKPRK